MSNRTKATSIPKKVREEVYTRDKGCIVCGSTNFLQVAHFIGRARSGLGIKQNLVLLCGLCHREADNGKSSKEIKEIMRLYLEQLYPEFPDSERIYDKWKH